MDWQWINQSSGHPESVEQHGSERSGQSALAQPLGHTSSESNTAWTQAAGLILTIGWTGH